MGLGDMFPCHLHRAGVWGEGCRKEQQGIGKNASTKGCKTGHRFGKMGHVLEHARAHVPRTPIRARYHCSVAIQLGVVPSAAWAGKQPARAQQAAQHPKKPWWGCAGRGVTPEGCCKFSIYRDGGWGGRGWSPAIFYSRCIPKILVKCNIKLWKFSRGKAFLPLTWPANQKGAPHLPHFWQLFSNWAQLKFPKS